MSKLDRFPMIERSVALTDLDVGGADGRTVSAYAATFGNEYAVSDFDAPDYDESINRTAFNRHLAQHGLRNVAVIFNHGLTMWGTPSDKFSGSLGTPLEIKPDGKGLLTVTRYNKTPTADEVLEYWRNGDVQAQSFRGPIVRSAPFRRGADGRMKRERLELGLVDYGPTLRAANVTADLVAIRSAMLLEQFTDLSDDERARLRTLLDGTPTVDPSSTPGTPSGPAAEPSTLGTGDAPPADDSLTETLILANANRRRH